MKKFYFLPKNSFYAFDIYAKNEKEAKQMIKKMLDKKTMHQIQFWAD
jgi:hypothetical protein